MANESYKLRVADAEKLTEDVQLIYSEIKVYEEEHEKRIAPLKQKIKSMEQAFLDKHLTDSTGKPVKKGMVIEKNGKRYQVLNRYQQCLLNYLGNARVSALPEGKKRTVEIFPEELSEYTIVE